MCTYPFAKKPLTLHLARGEGRERYFGCNLMQRKVLASSHQHFHGGSTRNSTQNSRSTFESRGRFTERRRTASYCRRATFSRAWWAPSRLPGCHASPDGPSFSRGTTCSFSSTLLHRWPGSDRVQNLHRGEDEFAVTSTLMAVCSSIRDLLFCRSQGAAPKACSQTRRKLAKSKPSKTTFRPNPCILQHPRTFALVLDKVQSNERLPGAKFTARSSPRSPRVGGFQGRLSC